MATVPSVRVVKTIPFKGGTRLTSNRYSFTGGTPADDTHWHTLMDNIVTAEKAVHHTAVVISECLGYAAGSDVPVSTKTYSTAGTLSLTAGDHYAPAESAALVRWTTSARSVKNHPIYAFSYFHIISCQPPGASMDLLSANEKTALQTYATAWVTGFSDGSGTYVRATPSGHTCNGSVVEEYATHRDFPYTRSL